MPHKNTLQYAQELDHQDPLAHLRDQFYFPQFNHKNTLYFTGNSLGLQPKQTQHYINEVMADWANMAVEAHFKAQKPWWDYHERLAAPLAKIVGALPLEITVMNTLTVNLHLMMVSFYQPTKKRYKIICEEKAFPSDQYLLQSQTQFHNLDPNQAIIPIKPRPGEHNIHQQDIIDAINQAGDTLALVLIGGVNYYTGQVFDIQTITQAAQAQGAKVGWDLAHAAGNINLQLHDWNVDFACWCSYKYMNSGPGNAAGCFIHQKHHNNPNLPRFAGWWGHNKQDRFKMAPTFDPIQSADGWQISNLPILTLAPYLSSLEIFDQVGMTALIKKRNQLTSYLLHILQQIATQTNSNFEVITPEDPTQRASQISVLLHGKGRYIFDHLIQNGVIIDWREPNVIRLAPVPLYNSFTDIYQFGQILKQGILNH